MSGSSTLDDLVKYQIGKNIDSSHSRGEHMRFTYGMSNTSVAQPNNQAQALQIISEMTPLKVQTEQQQQHISSLGQSYSGGLGKQSVMNTPQKEGPQQIRHPSQLVGAATDMISSQTPYLSQKNHDRIQLQNSEQQTMSSSNLLIAQQSSDFELKREIVQVQAQNAYLVPIDGESLFYRNKPLTDQQKLQYYQLQLAHRKQKSRKQHHKKDKRQENQVMEVYTARVINNGDNSDSTKHNNFKTSKKNQHQKGSETAYKETLPIMISAPASTQRRSSHKNINKKSAGSQNRQSKDGKGRSNFHNGGQPSASQVRTFNLIVSQNGEASLTPIRKHYTQANDSINMKAATTTSVNSSSILQNKQQKGGSSTAVDPNQQRRMQSTAPRLFSYKPKINDMKGSPFLQPIISQKSIIQPGNSLGPSSAGSNQQVMSQHGKQVIASMIKHQQQPPIIANQLKQQQAQHMRQSQLANYNGGGSVLSAIPAPLPKFLTKKNQRLNMMNQQQTAQLQQNLQQNNQQQQQRKNTSVLDSFIAQQQYLYMQNNQQQYHSGSGDQEINGNMILAENARTGPLGQNSINGRNSVQPGQHTQHSSNNSNGQIKGQVNTSQGSGASILQGANSQNMPVVNYLMQIHQSQNQAQTQKRQNQQSYVAQSQQPILQRSSSNVMTQFQNQNSIQVQGQQYMQREGSKQSLIIVDSQGTSNKVKTLQPQFMILGQSPSNQRLHSHNNSLGQKNWNQTGGGQVGDLRLNGVGQQVLSDSNANQRTQSLAAGAATFHHNLSKQFAQINAAGQYQTGGAMPQYFDEQNYYQHQMHLSDDDGGIDERFDGDDDSVNNNDSDDIQDDQAHTSPKAPKPKPLDQTFQPQKGKKYFSVTIGYPAMRRALRARGWIEVKCYKKLQNIAGYTSSPCKLANVGLESTMARNFDQNIDLKFVLSAQDANHQNLKNACLINQNRGEGNLTCKSGLKESLSRSYQHMACWYPMEHCDPAGLGPDSFFPRSHVINSAESLQEFQRDFCLTEAENYLRKFIRKFKGFKEGQKLKQQAATVRTSTPGTNQNKRTPSKNRQSMKKMKSKTQLSSNEGSPVKGAQEEIDYTDQTTIVPNSQQQSSQQDSNCSLQELGFLKEKLVICCNIMRKRLKPVEDKLDTKKGIRTDRMTAGVILIEERSFLLRSPKNLSAAYLKYIQKEDWYIKALSSFPQFKKDKSLAPPLQQTAMCEKIAKTCSDFIERLRPLYPQTDLNGYNNLWIVKPGGLSRGRKIRLFKDFQKILEYSEVDAAQQLHAANGLASSNNPSGANTQYYMSHMKPGGDDVNAYTKKTWVIQKYIENPMLIMNRKFDIRVWVVISSWNPLRIYVYKECYMRFSCNDYDPRCPQNLFSHLTNNSVAKKAIERPDNARILNKIPGNMWNLQQFKEFLGGKPVKSNKRKNTSNEVDDVTSQQQQSQRPRTASDIPEKETKNDESTNMPLDSTINPIPNTGVSLPEGGEEEQQPEQNYEEIGEEVWETKWYPQIKEIIIQSILSAWDKIEWRKGGVGLYGFDVFPDADGKLWLLEINKCPTMEYSTQVTKVLVPRFLEDLVELIIDKRKGDHPEVAGFEKIYDVGKLRDLTDFQQTQKDIKIDGKGIDAYNNQNYLSALHRNKRKADRNGGKVSHQHY